MGGIHVLAALLSAVLHAGWNAAVKASPQPAEAMAGQMVIGAVLILPALAWTGLPALAAWPWMIASTATNLLTIAVMLHAYTLGGFGVVYPVMRAVSVLCVVPLSAGLAGDHLSLGALGGIGLIAGSLAMLALSAGRDQSFSPRALLWTLAAGVCTGGYVMFDARGVRLSGSSLSYGFTVSIVNALTMSWRVRKFGAPWQIVRRNWRISTPAAIASMASYLLILWVWTQAPIAPAAALRDTSAVFAILIAVVWLKERITPARLAALVLAAAAVPLLRLV